MALSPGTRIGSYEVVGALGAGGMGEVYRARDTRLQRDVAIKVLPEAVARDPDRLQRFEREARTLAALNHPNIAQVHGLESGASTAATSMLVMELVEGDDLSELIARGPLPIDQAIAIARQIAEALDAAHSAGIVHRDLKPANVKVRQEGAVKVLDFGLAKPYGQNSLALSGVRRAGVEGPTVTTPAMTMQGMILGTAAYMSPEQARGRAVDKRADIWAFGCVLYEMLTGRCAFEGETVTDVLGAIVTRDPDWTRLPADTPPNINSVLRRCLQKDAAKRLRDIGDALNELDPNVVAQSSAPQPAIAARAPSIQWRRTSALIGAVLLAAAAAAIGYFARPEPESPLQKFHLAVLQDGGTIRHPAISPDGRSVVYGGQSRLWVQSIDQWSARELAGTEAAGRPFWSPDSRWIAYFRSELLLKVPVDGGPVVRIARLPAVQAPLGANSGAWGADGTITISLASGPLLQVSSGGGDVRPLDGLAADAATSLRDLEALPNGALLGALVRSDGNNAIAVLHNGTLRVVHGASNLLRPAYVPPGHLVYERRAPNSSLWAVPFSLDRLAVTGDAFVVGAGSELSASRGGTLSFLATDDAIARELAWFTMDGQRGARIADAREWIEGASLSRDGRRLLASASDGIWVYDVETGARSRVTSGASDMTPNWIDDRRIVFVRSAPGAGAAPQTFHQPMVMIKHLAGSSEELVLAPQSRFPRVSADGRRVVFNIQAEGQSGWQIGWVDLHRPAEIRRLGGQHLGARFPSVSPDGTLVAYISGEMERDEVFLTRLPSGEGKWQVSTEGGGWTLFSPRGDAVVYRAPDGAMMSVPIGGGADIKIGRPQKLFDWGGTWAPFYDIAADGTRGVAAIPAGRSVSVPKLSIVQNWHREFMGR
jgi:dipeptidyl aminopeptidase/acylaminoacyl peptidase